MAWSDLEVPCALFSKPLHCSQNLLPYREKETVISLWKSTVEEIWLQTKQSSSLCVLLCKKKSINLSDKPLLSLSRLSSQKWSTTPPLRRTLYNFDFVVRVLPPIRCIARALQMVFSKNFFGNEKWHSFHVFFPILRKEKMPHYSLWLLHCSENRVSNNDQCWIILSAF